MRRNNKFPEKQGPGLERWLITYADLITLLMIFFIVMYSMSQLDVQKFRAIANSLSIALGGGTPANIDLAPSSSGPSLIESGGSEPSPQISDSSINPPINPEEGQTGNGPEQQETLTLEGIKAKLDQFAIANNIQTKLISTIEERGLVVSIQDTLLFAKGSAEITPTARTILKKISTVLAASPNYIRVEGHTCNLPIHTSHFPSNWELSVLRATNVVHILVEEGGIDAARLSAVGYGEYRPIADNSTEEGRIKNRRVDLVVLNSKYKVVEPGH